MPSISPTNSSPRPEETSGESMLSLHPAPVFDFAAGAVEQVSLSNNCLQVKAHFPDLSSLAPEPTGSGIEVVSLTHLGFGVAQGITGDPGHFFDPKGDYPMPNAFLQAFESARNAGGEQDADFLRALGAIDD